MKLKTLNDLPLHEIDEAIVKAEAIKWVKRLEKEKTPIKPLSQIGKNFNLQKYAQQEILKMFHNITEEDLQ